MYSYWYNLAEINCTPWALQCPIKIYFLPHVVLNPFNSSTLEAEICLSEFETSLRYITMSRTVNSQHYTETMSHRTLKENKENYYLFEMHRVLLHLKCSVLCKKKNRVVRCSSSSVIHMLIYKHSLATYGNDHQ